MKLLPRVHATNDRQLSCQQVVGKLGAPPRDSTARPTCEFAGRWSIQLSQGRNLLGSSAPLQPGLRPSDIRLLGDVAPHRTLLMGSGTKAIRLPC